MEIQMTMSSKSNCRDAPAANVKSNALSHAVTISQLLRCNHTNASQRDGAILEKEKNPVLCIKKSGKWLTRIFKVDRPSLILVPYNLERP